MKTVQFYWVAVCSSLKFILEFPVDLLRADKRVDVQIHANELRNSLLLRYTPKPTRLFRLQPTYWQDLLKLFR